MKIGFTGSRSGMTASQRTTFRVLIEKLCPSEFHHGDCLGADEESHEIVRELFPRAVIVIHPPISLEHRAGLRGDVDLPAKDYLVRNRDIVNDSGRMIATPATDKEVLRSGTWATVRYAIRVEKAVHLISPGGMVREY